MKKENNRASASIFIIIVNWNNFSDTVECIDSLLLNKYNNKKIILIDNGSSDNSVQKIREWIKLKNCDDFITILQIEQNIGFGGANNKGIQYALDNNADFILLLNNDTVVTEDFIDKLITTSLINKKIGVIGCRIHYYNNKEQVWFSGGIINYFKGAFYHKTDICSNLIESDFITGCLMLIPSEVFKAVGFFDENYFLNVEDIDFSCRVKEAGYSLIVNCNVIIYHKVSASIGGLYSMRNQYYFHRNRMYFFNKRLPFFKKLLFNLVQFLTLIPVWITIQLFKKRFKAVQSALFGYFDYLRGIKGKSTFC